MPKESVEWDLDANLPMYTRDYLRLIKEGWIKPNHVFESNDAEYEKWKKFYLRFQGELKDEIKRTFEERERARWINNTELSAYLGRIGKQTDLGPWEHYCRLWGDDRVTLRWASKCRNCGMERP